MAKADAAIEVRDGDVLLMVGTMKGAFLARSRRARARWEVSGPLFPGSAVYAMAYDDRGTRRRLWAGVSSMHWGAVLRRSDDLGRTWTDPKAANVKFPEATGAALKQIWQIEPGRADEPDTLYCGVEPAALFESKDAGATWKLVQGLWDHPHRERWQPGGGGLCLHTILPDAANRRRMFIATSTGGVYRTDDGGRSWSAKNRGIRTYFLPDKYPEFGQCVHKMAQHPSRPERIYLQHHFGIYRSDDAGDSWRDVGKSAAGVPSDFGFPLVVHPHDPDSFYVLPLASDQFRCPPEGKLRVYRTRDAGATWKPLARGLPQKRAFETVLRDAMGTDRLKPAGIYFGTRSGKLFSSRDEGASWSCLADGLPPIVCVRASVVAPPRRSARPARASA
jgi:hypothetical protein